MSSWREKLLELLSQPWERPGAPPKTANARRTIGMRCVEADESVAKLTGRGVE